MLPAQLLSLLPPLLLTLSPAVVSAGSLADPYSVAAMQAAAPADAGICRGSLEGRQLTLADVVEARLCNNPQTRASWAAIRNAAEQYGISRASLLPTLSLQGSASHAAAATGNTHSVSNGQSATLSLSYLLYDFGGREAAIENARALLDAANASGNAAVQTLFLNAAQAYFSLMSARAAVAASTASEAAARESLSAAEVRYQAGAATPADRLQARTALSQATLTRVRAEGTMANALGSVANIMGISPTTPLAFAPPPTTQDADIGQEQDVGRLISDAMQRRPDLQAVEARIDAAEAGIDAARAAGRPRFRIDAAGGAGATAPAGSGYAASRSGSIALNVSIPIFTGFATSYRVRAAEAQLESNLADRELIGRRIELQVWQAYQNLRSEGEALRAADDLLASAEASETLNRNRYRAGAGTILDLLNSQSAMATARQQHVTALFNWHAARFSLAQAIGELDLGALQQTRDKEQ